MATEHHTARAHGDQFADSAQAQGTISAASSRAQRESEPECAEALRD
jgi:hypothetical protein